MKKITNLLALLMLFISAIAQTDPGADPDLPVPPKEDNLFWLPIVVVLLIFFIVKARNTRNAHRKNGHIVWMGEHKQSILEQDEEGNWRINYPPSDKGEGQQANK
jgi:hypothetical protein